MTSSAKVAAVLALAAVGGGIFAGIDLHGRAAVKPPARAKVREAPMGPVHGLMLAPLADPDGRVPTGQIFRGSGTRQDYDQVEKLLRAV